MPPAGGTAPHGPSCVGWLGVRAGKRRGEGSLLRHGQTFGTWRLLFKPSSLHGDEVPRLRRPALEPLVLPVGGYSWPLEPTFFPTLFMSTPNLSSGPREVPGQALETSSSGRTVGDVQKHSEDATLPAASGGRHQRKASVRAPVPTHLLDTLYMKDVLPSMTYRAIHSCFKTFGAVSRICLKYDGDTTSNRLYVTFVSSDAAKAAHGAASSLSLSAGNSTTALMRSANLADSDQDYHPNVFEGTVDETTPAIRQIPTPRWFVAYYRDEKANFIHAARYLEKEIGVIPEGHLKKYGKGVLVRAKDVTQAKMLLHLPCPSDSMFESVKPHRTFNYSKGCVYNDDLAEFSVEQILQMCPNNVRDVSKIKGSNHMAVLTFFGSNLPDRVKIGPLSLKVKPFLDRPLQCYQCYGYGHGKKYCKESPRCGNCSALESHPTSECVSEPYCFYCRGAHPLRSRQCERYRLEQDILQLANSQYISLGSARRELLFKLKKGGGSKTYASTAGARLPSLTVSNSKLTSVVPPGAPNGGTPAVPLQNKFTPLSSSPETPSHAPLDEQSSALTTGTVVADVHVPTNASPGKHTNTNSQGHYKRRRGSSESLESVGVPPPKVPPPAMCATSPPRVRFPENILSASETICSPVPSPTESPATPCAVGVTDMDANEVKPLVDEAIPDNLVRQMSQECLPSASQIRCDDEPDMAKASSLGSVQCTVRTSSLSSLETRVTAVISPPDCPSRKPVPSPVTSASAPRPRSSHIPVSFSAGRAEVRRPGSSSHKPASSSARASAPPTIRRYPKTQTHTGSGKSLPGTRPKKPNT